ncbi:hypothetical protein ACHAWF_017807, partial [Thalassiosira exigua]
RLVRSALAPPVVRALLFLLVAASRQVAASGKPDGSGAAGTAAAKEEEDDPCRLYLAESTIPNAGLGVFAGKSYSSGELLGRVGDPTFPTIDHDWHNSPPSGHLSKLQGNHHWPLTNYHWQARDVGCEHEAEDVTAVVAGFGAVPNCHFRLLNVDEDVATYDAAGLSRYDSPGAGASTPWFNRTSAANQDTAAGSELFVDYGSNWFQSREEFQLVPVDESYFKAQNFLKKYGRLLAGSDEPEDLAEDKMPLDEESRKDLWEIVKTFPYPTREREALPRSHEDAVRAIHGDIQVIEKENSIRSVDYLKDHGKCVDNIVPGPSSIPHAGRGAFATRFIPRGGLVAPAPLVHIADKATMNMYAETVGPHGNMVRDEEKLVSRQIILNYVFGHPNSTVLLFPYSSNVAYINHDVAKYNAELRWATNTPWFHHEDWLNKSVEFLEHQGSSGLMLEFIALRDIQPGEEVLINYGDEWQKAWDEHVKNWKPIAPESDFNNLTLWTEVKKNTYGGKEGYYRAETLNKDMKSPLRTMYEQEKNPLPYSVAIQCIANVNHDAQYLFAPRSTPYFYREWRQHMHYQECQITERYLKEDDMEDSETEEDSHNWMYTVTIVAEKNLPWMEESITENHRIYDVPRNAIEYKDVPYTSDIFLKNAFRHEMHLPDEVFPIAWRNLLPEK